MPVSPTAARGGPSLFLPSPIHEFRYLRPTGHVPPGRLPGLQIRRCKIQEKRIQAGKRLCRTGGHRPADSRIRTAASPGHGTAVAFRLYRGVHPGHPTRPDQVNRRGKSIIVKGQNREDLDRYHKGLAVIDEIFRTTGARQVIHGTLGIGLHLMGGCGMGTDPARSVVDPGFRLHGSTRDLSADSSIFPNAPGINPSLTIMALVQKGRRADRKGWQPMKISRHFTRRQLLRVEQGRRCDSCPARIAPRPFRRTGCIDHVDRMAGLPDGRRPRRVACGPGAFCRFSPRWLIRLLMTACANNDRAPGPLGSVLRTLEVGVKGAGHESVLRQPDR